MKPAAFDYHRPANLDEAIALLASLQGEVCLIAGGQSLGPMLNLRLARPDHIVDINDIGTLDGIENNDKAIEIGALVRHHRLTTDTMIRRHLPILADAAATIGHYAIRQRGTIGGSLAHADPAAQLPLIAVLLDAEIVCRSPAGERRLPAREFIHSIMTTALAPTEIVTAVRLPVLLPATGWGFEIFSRRRGDFAIVAVGALLGLDTSGRVETLQIAIAGMEDTAIRLDEDTNSFLARVPDDDWIAKLSSAVARSGNPQDSPGIPRDFRIELARTLSRRALTTALDRCKEFSGP
ncbi:MAG: FAD binding domain-containing protein [Hyphomicrobiaceae bacterium]